jgi:hypothetical protein
MMSLQSSLSFGTGARCSGDDYASALTRGKNMGIAADILGLRNQHFSSVAELLAALELVYEAPVDKISARVFLAGQVADLVLTNVAAHAAEALREQPAIRKTRRRAAGVGRKNRRFDVGPSSQQRILFA